MKRKRAVVIASFASALSLLLSEAVVLPACAAEEIRGLTETEEEGGNISEPKREGGGEADKNDPSQTKGSGGQVTEDGEKTKEQDTQSEDGEETDDKEHDISGEETGKDIGSGDVTGEGSESDDGTTQEGTGTDVTEKGAGSDSDVTEGNEGEAQAGEEDGTDGEEDGENVNPDGASAEAVGAENVLTDAPVRLQVPQKFEIVLNPWEMDGEEQIYSEEYTIKNSSGVKGTLKLTGIAVGTEEDVEVRENDDDISEGNDRSIFVEMIINGEERLVLSPEGTDYEIMLEADAGVTLAFTGALNENAREGWRDNDVEISVIYDWLEDGAEAAAQTQEGIADKEGMYEDAGAGEGAADDAVTAEGDQNGLNGEKTEEGQISATDTDSKKEPDKIGAETDAMTGGENPGAETSEDNGTEEEKSPGTEAAEEDGVSKEEYPGAETPKEDLAPKEENPDMEAPKEDTAPKEENFDVETSIDDTALKEENRGTESTEEIRTEEEDGTKK